MTHRLKRAVTDLRSALAARSAGVRLVARGSVLAAARDGGLMTIYLPGVEHPLFARPGSTDLHALKQVTDGGYLIDLPFEPRLVFDLGANVGYSSFDFALRYPHARILAVEPEPTNASLLRRNVAALGRVDVIEAAVWPTTGGLELENAGSGKWDYRVRANGVEGAVRAVTVDELLRKAGARSVDLVKMDIEGSEMELLSADTDWIGRVGALVIELHDRFRPGCREALDRAIDRSGVAFDESRHGESVVLVRRDPPRP